MSGVTRGRPPTQGIRQAVMLARARGIVMEIRQTNESPAVLVITGNSRVTFVRIRRIESIRRSPAEIEAEDREAIALLRTIPGNNTISRELWVYSKFGTWRFFSVEDGWLLEIHRDGSPLI
ncbi:MAG: hypothetical protein GYA23_06175 [Methanomicrobiales archaeon]|nr:hypothetical protein [Methanomicrobiales archaeon]